MAQEALPQAFDLGAFARQLQRRKDPDCKRVAGALQAAVDACSAHADLVMTHNLIVNLARDDELYKTHSDKALEKDVRGAALSTAILMYVRATESGNARPGLQIRQKLLPDEQELHRELCDLRKKAVAHFDRGKIVNGRAWADETIVLTDDGILRVPIRRIIGQSLFEKGFYNLVTKALALAETMRVDRFTRAQAELFDLVERRPELAPELRKHPFDAFAFFGDKDTACDFLTTGQIMTRPERHIEYD